MAKETPVYRPSKAEDAMRVQIQKDWFKARAERTRTYKCLMSSQTGERNIDTFITNCRDNFNGYAPKNTKTQKAWRSNVFYNDTRNKVMATVATFIGMGLGLDFKALDEDDKQDKELSGVIEDCFDWSTEREEFDFTQMKAFMEMTITGTCHLLEEIVWEERIVKAIKDYDPKTGNVITETKNRVDFHGAKAEFIPNEEIHVGNFYISDIQEQPFVIRRKVTSYSGARSLLSKWKNWKYVQSGSIYFLGNMGSENTEVDRENLDDKVEIVWYWNKPDDTFAIVANGVLLTPVDYPFPYPHKNYPISKSIFEPFADQRFYWGNSLVNKELDPQFVVNYLIRYFIDSTGLQLRPPLLGNGTELSGMDMIIPGAFADLPPGTEVKTIPEIAGGVSSSAFQVMNLVRDMISQSSIDPLVSGQSAQGNPTATEVNAIVGSAQQMKGLNAQFIGHLLLSHARLRIPNILWLITHDKDFSEIVRHDVKVEDGSNGAKVIRFLDAGNIPVKKQDAMEMVVKMKKDLNKDSHITHEVVIVNKDNIEDYRYHVSIAPFAKSKESSVSRMQKAMQKYQLLSQNPLVDMRELTSNVIESWGDDPEKLLQPIAQSLQGVQAGAPEATPQTVNSPVLSGQSVSPQQSMGSFLGM